jgi:hypothetical protein
MDVSHGEATNRVTQAMKRISNRWWTACVVAAVVAVVGYNVWTSVRPRYGSEFMDARWAADPAVAPGSVAGRVTGWDGRPEVGLKVSSDALPRNTLMTVTDKDGRFLIPGAGDLYELSFVGIDSIPLSHWNLPAHAGVSFEVRLKRPPPPLRGPL